MKLDIGKNAMEKQIKLSGIKQQHANKNSLDFYKEQFERKGYVILKNIFDRDWISKLQNAYDKAIEKNKDFYINQEIEMSKKEQGIIRQIYRYDDIFLQTILKKEISEIADCFIDDDWIITQQNGSHIDYKNLNNDTIGVQVWHRDFVFRHITTSKPLLINMLIPLDSFTKENGATNLLPYSHLFPDGPSNDCLAEKLGHAESEPGDVSVLNGLTYHAGGQNTAGTNRRSFNTVFGVPAMRHQVEPFPENMSEDFIEKYKKCLTGGYTNNPSVLEYIKERNS